MNWIDLLLAIVLLSAILHGWYRGFILGSLSLLSWAGSFILGYIFYPYTAAGLGKVFHTGVWLQPAAFILTLVIARILIALVVRYLIKAVPEHTHNGIINKFLGIIPGAINGLLATVIVAALLLALPLNDQVTEETRNSRFAGPLAMQAEWVNRKLAPVFDDAVRQSMNSLTVHPESGEKITLPFKYNHAAARPGLEAKMLELVNEERAKQGLRLLKADPELMAVARAHSQDMFARGYFATSTPKAKILSSGCAKHMSVSLLPGKTWRWRKHWRSPIPT